MNGVWTIINLIELGFDVHVHAPAPETWQLMASALGGYQLVQVHRTGLVRRSARLAIDIRFLHPLGENPGLQLGDLRALGQTDYTATTPT